MPLPLTLLRAADVISECIYNIEPTKMINQIPLKLLIYLLPQLSIISPEAREHSHVFMVDCFPFFSLVP